MSETRELLEGFLGGTKPITEVGTGRKYYLNPQTEEKYYLDEYNKNPYAIYKNNDMQVPLLLDNKGNRILRDDYDRSNDNYFHCKSHYQMADRGDIGYQMSPIIGYPREIIDYAKGIAQGKSLTTLNNDWRNDIEVNNYGRNAEKSGIYNSAQEACTPFRPSGLHSDF